MSRPSENEHRANRAFRTMLVYGQYAGEENEDQETLIVDLMTDLLHDAKNCGYDLAACLERARMHYDAEVLEGVES